MKKYRHLFFDLDHTLWDFATNERLTLNELFDKYDLRHYFKSFNEFYERYVPINTSLWEKYRNWEIRKIDLSIGRFHQTFQTAGLDNIEMAELFSNEFVATNSQKTNVVPFTFDLLEYLKPHYTMHIITNGFTESQKVKLERSGLKPYFKKVFISEEIGVQKPKKGFFEYALKSCNAKKTESLVIGDSLEIDILGAKNFGLDHVYYNPYSIPHEVPVFKEIASLHELIGWL
jgi:putative hydrolase of the HAD superfamily